MIVARDGGGKTAATEKATVPARGGGATSPTPPVTNPGTTPDGGENLARAGTASMSSTFPGEPGIQHGADRAVDGNTGGDFRKGEVSRTDKGDGSVPAWWQVDLGQSRDLGKITVWNRTDSYSEQLNDFWVFVSDRPFDPNRTPEQRFDDGIAGFRCGSNRTRRRRSRSPRATGACRRLSSVGLRPEAGTSTLARAGT